MLNIAIVILNIRGRGWNVRATLLAGMSEQLCYKEEKNYNSNRGDKMNSSLPVGFSCSIQIIPNGCNAHDSNIVRSVLMKLWKGEEPSIARSEGSQNGLIISSQSWIEIDRQLKLIGSGTSFSVFGRRPRVRLCYSSWKAEEYRMQNVSLLL